MTVSSLAKKMIGVNKIVVENVDLETTAKGEQLVIRARSRKSSQKRCSVCGRECPGFDQGKGLRRWRAPDFGSGIKVFIEAEAPRVRCPEHGVVVKQVPWARHRSGFTKNFEDTAVWLSLQVKELSGGHKRYDRLVRIAIDETSYKKGHKYLMLLLNHDTNAVVWIRKGYGKVLTL